MRLSDLDKSMSEMVPKYLNKDIYCCDAVLGYKRTGNNSPERGKLEFEKDCEFDEIAGEYLLWRY